METDKLQVIRGKNSSYCAAVRAWLITSGQLMRCQRNQLVMQA